MKELDFINTIKKHIGTEYIGDDCAHLQELGIVVTQDSMVENIHFKREWSTPYQLGYKSIAVNISDILASGAEPAYLTVAISLPNDINDKFIDEFYKGAKSALHGAKIVGGDITGSDKIVISITAIGKTNNRKISSRKNAKIGYKIITRGQYGLSSAGLKELMTGGKNIELINSHLMPVLDETFSKAISENIKEDYAMMDTSDGLADALFKIAEESNVSIVAKEVPGMFGAEDYNLIAAVPNDYNVNIDGIYVVGQICTKQNFVLKIGETLYNSYDELNLFNHFE